MKKNNIILVAFNLVFLWNCSTQNFYKKAQNGDIVFVEAKKENISGAISRVTKTNENTTSYDHTALIEVRGKEKNILHSSGENGSERISLKTFIKKNRKEKRRIDLYRLKDTYKNCTDKAIQKANTMLGKPYNWLYILNENAYYCSDFVERAYRDCHIFELKPMTFINPNTKTTDEYWIEFYQSKNTEVPEGKLGCNPNGISKSDKIYKVFSLK